MGLTCNYECDLCGHTSTDEDEFKPGKLNINVFIGSLEISETIFGIGGGNGYVCKDCIDRIEAFFSMLSLDEIMTGRLK